MAIPSVWDLAAAMFEPPTERFASPADLADTLDPKHRRTPVIDYIDQRLVEAYNTSDSRMILSVPPQSGKSQLAARRFALWALTQNPNCRIAIASYEMGVARRWGRTIRDDIRTNEEKLGSLRVRDDVSSQSEWMLDRGYEGGVYSVGVGGALTGRPVDLMIIDDPVKDAEQAGSATYQERLWSWWQTTAQTRLSPGAPVVIIQTRWSTNDLAGRLLSEHADEWTFANITAQADHRPEKAETDPLGREPGEFLAIPSGRSVKQWEQRKRNTDPKTWAALYMGRPTPDEGGVFPRTDEWARYSEPIAAERPDGTMDVPGWRTRDDTELIQSWDLTFKDTGKSDFVVGQVWLRVGATVYLLDQVRHRMNFDATEAAIRAMVKKWGRSAVLIEDKANGPAIISRLRKEIPGIIPVEPEGSKYARAQAITPYARSGNIVLPETRLLPDQMKPLMEEILGFPHQSHDDTVDAMTQAVKQLLIDNIDDTHLGETLDAEDLGLIGPAPQWATPI